MNDLTDRELYSRFAQLRAADLSGVPDFGEALGRASQLPADTAWSVRRWPRRIAIPVAIAATIVIAAGIVRVSRRRDYLAPPLSTWTSPTAALLGTPVGVLGPPHLLTSALDPTLPTTAFRRGTKR